MKVCPLVDERHNNIHERLRCKALNEKVGDLATDEEFHPIDYRADHCRLIYCPTLCPGAFRLNAKRPIADAQYIPQLTYSAYQRKVRVEPSPAYSALSSSGIFQIT
jgi:hypothetical protein